MRIKYISIIPVMIATFLTAQSEQPFPPLDLVTIPTSGTLPKGSFTIENLLMKGGGILPSINIGITDNFTIGLFYGFQNFIGDEKAVQINIHQNSKLNTDYMRKITIGQLSWLG